MKKILVIVVLLPVIFILGCARTADTIPETPKVLRVAQIGSEWEAKQITITLEAGQEISVLLKLAAGDKVDGYFYLEEGNKVDFSIMGNSLIYEPGTQDVAGTGRVSSDRFSFVADEVQGNAYLLKFRNVAGDGDKGAKAIIFLDFIYPATASVFAPLGAE